MYICLRSREHRRTEARCGGFIRRSRGINRLDSPDRVRYDLCSDRHHGGSQRMAMRPDPMRQQKLVVGVISDTHGLLRPQALAALRGSDMIIHAGDIGKPEIIDQLGAVAPTVAIRGNVDAGDWAARFPPTRVVEVGELKFYMVHAIAQLGLDPATAGFAA